MNQLRFGKLYHTGRSTRAKAEVERFVPDHSDVDVRLVAKELVAEARGSYQALFSDLGLRDRWRVIYNVVGRLLYGRELGVAEKEDVVALVGKVEHELLREVRSVERLSRL